MNKKIKSIFLVLSLFALTGCNPSTTNNDDDTPVVNDDDNNKDDNKGDDTENTSVIKSLTANSENHSMSIGSSVTLSSLYTMTRTSGTLKASEKKVTAVSSNSEVITIKNNTVAYAAGLGTAKVTITSKTDETKKCEINFTVTDTYFDRSISNVSPSDDFTKELIEDGGTVRTSGMTAEQDLFIKGLDATKFMIWTTIEVHSVNASENFPKYGITVSTEENYSDNQCSKNKFVFFFNPEKVQTETEFDGFGVCEIENGSNWAWNTGVNNAQARHSDFMYRTPTKMALTDKFSLKLIRNGVDFHFYVNNTYVKSAKTLDDLFKKTTDGNTVDVSSRAGFFQFNSDVTFSEYGYSVNEEEVDKAISDIGTIDYLTDWADD